IYKLYQETYQDEQFVRVLPLGKQADLKFVTYTNYCDISLHMDERNHTLIVVSTIDNMVKGTAGQAIQNMNLMFGLKENTGLNYVGPSF
ncbi:MAG TPA: N-acetyl-gamma-glutamyl-phosphate reductase, partial [Erysipelotrichaceae bacterium]|nr:N-acetyl-gamma-glutamyl-phosphate reductase [Erysipelotrichaceae bacterium]